MEDEAKICLDGIRGAKIPKNVPFTVTLNVANTDLWNGVTNLVKQMLFDDRIQVDIRNEYNSILEEILEELNNGEK